MTSSSGRCSNFDYCGLAARKQDIDVELGANFVCPECGKALKPPPVPVAKTGGSGRIAALAGVAVLLLAGGIFVARGLLTAPAHVAAPPVAAPARQETALPQHPAMAAPAAALPVHQAIFTPPPAAPTETIVLRLSGSNTVGAVLGPKLAQAFLTSTGDTNVTIVPASTPDEVKITGARGDKKEAITVAAHGSATAFTALAHGQADIGMASRRIKPAEAVSLAALGDMAAAQNEHVLALDGIAVVVNPANPVGALTRTQLQSLFSGAITDWSQLGSAAGPVHLYARDDKSGTFDTFKNLVLGTAKLAASARRIEDSRELSNDVAADRGGIGFIGLPYILSARAVPVADIGATPLLANRLTVGTEDYPLSRRLYLYTAASSANPLVQRFAEFALSPDGQAIVQAAGFVPLTVTSQAVPVPQTASAKYRALVGRATRLSTNFRFEPNSTALDNRGQRDLDRLVNFVLSAHAAPSQIILVGFADNKGSSTANLAVSKNRAEAVADVLAEHGVKVGHVAAFGADLPVADNTSDDGREKNRRVEVFVQM